MANALTLLIKRRIRVQVSGFAENDLPQSGRHIHRHERNGVTGFLIVKLGNIKEAILKIADDVVVGTSCSGKMTTAAPSPSRCAVILKVEIARESR